MSDRPEQPAPDPSSDRDPSPAAENADGTPPTPRCAECGAELAPDQTYCLECGTPTERAPRLRRRGRGLALVSVALIALAAGAGALAYAVANRGEDAGPIGSTAQSHQDTGATDPWLTIPTDPGTGALPPDTSSFTDGGYPTDAFPTTDGGYPTDAFPTTDGPPDTSSTPFPPVSTSDDFPIHTEQPSSTATTDGFPTVPPTTFSPTPAPTPTPTPNPTPTPTPTSPGGTTSDWPAGTTAWTVILSSVRNETAARNSAAAASVPAGVLFSSDHPGLRPGFWVVFTGEYPTQAAAAARARALAGRYPGAYPRRITG